LNPKKINLALENIKGESVSKGFHQEFLELAKMFSTSWRNELKKENEKFN